MFVSYAAQRILSQRPIRAFGVTLKSDFLAVCSQRQTGIKHPPQTSQQEDRRSPSNMASICATVGREFGRVQISWPPYSSLS